MLVKRQVTQERQIDAGCAAQVVIDVIGARVGSSRQLQQGKRHIGRDGHLELGAALRGNHERVRVHAVCHLLTHDIEIRMQTRDR